MKEETGNKKKQNNAVNELGWIEQAKADLKSAENSFKSKDYYASVFWAQQSVEKVLKAVLIKKTKKLVKIHDLILLGKMAELPEELLNKIKFLSGVYTESRYDIIGEEIPANKFKEQDSIEALNLGKEVLKWLEKEI